MTQLAKKSAATQAHSVSSYIALCRAMAWYYTHRNQPKLQQGEDGPLLGIPRGGAAPAQSMDRGGGGGGGGGGGAKPPQTKPTTF